MHSTYFCTFPYLNTKAGEDKLLIWVWTKTAPSSTSLLLRTYLQVSTITYTCTHTHTPAAIALKLVINSGHFLQLAPQTRGNFYLPRAPRPVCPPGPPGPPQGQPSPARSGTGPSVPLCAQSLRFPGPRQGPGRDSALGTAIPGLPPRCPGDTAGHHLTGHHLPSTAGASRPTAPCSGLGRERGRRAGDAGRTGTRGHGDSRQGRSATRHPRPGAMAKEANVSTSFFFCPPPSCPQRRSRSSSSRGRQPPAGRCGGRRATPAPSAMFRPRRRHLPHRHAEPARARPIAAPRAAAPPGKCSSAGLWRGVALGSARAALAPGPVRPGRFCPPGSLVLHCCSPLSAACSTQWLETVKPNKTKHQKNPHQNPTNYKDFFLTRLCAHTFQMSSRTHKAIFAESNINAICCYN